MRRPHLSGKDKKVLGVCIGLLVVITCVLWAAGLFRDRRSADERLAEIEAARAIPDSENAAMIYNELLQDPNATSVIDDLPESVETPTFERGLYEPWSSTDHPERAAWVERHRMIMDRLIEAARFEECRFPLSTDILDDNSLDRFAPMLEWEFLLNQAANYDVAEERIDAAIAKWRCLIQLANHLRQQPLLLDHANADYLPAFALESMARFIITGDPTETHLQTMETLPLPLANNWATYLQEMQTVHDLQVQESREQATPLQRLRSHLRSGFRYVAGKTLTPDYDEARNWCLSSMARARVVRIFVALKRYKNTAGYWPQSLDEIKPSLSEEILTDPFNGGPFAYRRTADTFSFYSRGYNGINENGDYVSGDDWPIWPPARETAGLEQENGDKVREDLE